MSKLNQRQNFATKLVKASQDEFKAVFEAAPVALVEGIWGKSFDVIKANPHALGLFGANDVQEFHQGFNRLLLKIPSRVLLDILSARVKGDFYEGEIRFLTFKRTYIHLFMRMAYIPSSSLGVQHVVLAFQDISYLKSQEAFLKKLSQIDGLTRVFNHRTILNRLDEELSRAKRYDLNLSCIILDVDSFKEINDTCGHLNGDKCLKRVADALKVNLRKTDIIGRYGGDEFLLVLPETKAEQATIPLQRFLDYFKPMNEMKSKGKSVTVTFSAGISSYPSGDINSVKDLIAKADAALYLSKSQGGNRFHTPAPKAPKA